MNNGSLAALHLLLLRVVWRVLGKGAYIKINVWSARRSLADLVS